MEPWLAVLVPLSMVSTMILGWLTFRKGSKADSALNLATNIKSTLDAQATHIDDLQEENREIKAECRACRQELDAAYEALREERKLRWELEQTVAKHERALAQVARREDMKPVREEDEERRSDGRT